MRAKPSTTGSRSKKTYSIPKGQLTMKMMLKKMAEIKATTIGSREGPSDGGVDGVVVEKERTCISDLAKLLPGNKLPCPDVDSKKVGEGDLSFNNQNRTPKRKFKDREEDFQSNCSPYAQESFYTIDRGRFTPKRKKANS